MKTVVVACIAVLLTYAQAQAVPIALFQDTQTFLERAKDIVIAKCNAIPKQSESFIDGAYPAEVSVLMVLKGEKKPGAMKIVTIYPMEAGTTYLLANTGGSTVGTDFFALGQLCVMPIPKDFDLKALQGKSTKEQVQRVFSRHLYDVQRKMAPLLEMQSLLEKGLSDRTDDVYESPGDVHIGEIHDGVVEVAKETLFLGQEKLKLEWSHSSPGEHGYFYFIGSGTLRWEFAASPHREIKDFDGKPLKAKFFGWYSPSRDKTTLKWSGDSAIEVSVGQVVLARTLDEPKTIYIIKIVKEDTGREALSVKYAVIPQEAK